MHIISRKKIIDFCKIYSEATAPLDRWYRILKLSDYNSFSELKLTFPQADQVGNLTVFNIGGNKFRLIAFIVYKAKRIYIREILTHSDYDKGNWKE